MQWQPVQFHRRPSEQECEHVNSKTDKGRGETRTGEKEGAGAIYQASTVRSSNHWTVSTYERAGPRRPIRLQKEQTLANATAETLVHRPRWPRIRQPRTELDQFSLVELVHEGSGLDGGATRPTQTELIRSVVQ